MKDKKELPPVPKFRPPKLEKDEMKPKKPLGLQGKMDYMYNKFMEYEAAGDRKARKAKTKQFKLPWKIELTKKAYAKKGKTTVLYLGNNKSATFKVAQVFNGMVAIDGKIHEASPDFFFLYKNTPLLIVPEWSLSPFGTKDYYDALAEKRTAEPQNIIIRAIELAEVMTKKPFPKGMFILLGIGAIVVFYVLFAGG